MIQKIKGWDEFLALCADIQSPEILKEIFQLFLTLEEQEHLAARYLIIKALLEERLTQREIAEIHQVSIAQITRGSNALKTTPHTIRDLLRDKMITRSYDSNGHTSP